MSSFIHDDFLLQTESARRLYHEFAENQPIIDYHCHLDPGLISENHRFRDITEVWLDGDHYKWRAMRSNGISEKFCTGDAEPRQKFLKWAETVPKTLRNPLFHWTHLELKRYFGIDGYLNPDSAQEIYESANQMLADESFYCRNLLKRMNVQVVCTTDDPIDDLNHHQNIACDNFEVKVLPTFRPDKASTIVDSASYNNYLDKLGEVSGIDISGYEDLLESLSIRHGYFHEHGCRLSDHGLGSFSASEAGLSELKSIFNKLRQGEEISEWEKEKISSGVLWELAKMDHEKGWVQQFHYGALRNNNSRIFNMIGPDTGFDSMDDKANAREISLFLNKLDSSEQLAKTILYNLNPSDNEMLATMIGNFQDGSVPGKMQFGSGWWFLDQKDGMERQLNTLSVMGLLSRFVGMLTDSRSFLSYPRHEYFRRILCNLLGDDIEKGLLPNDIDWVGGMVKDICYNNARNYFGFFA